MPSDDQSSRLPDDLKRPKPVLGRPRKDEILLSKTRDVRTLLNGLAAHLKAKLVKKPEGHPGAGKSSPQTSR